MIYMFVRKRNASIVIMTMVMMMNILLMMMIMIILVYMMMNTVVVYCFPVGIPSNTVFFYVDIGHTRHRYPSVLS